MTEIRAGWDTRGYVAAQVSFIDGYPYEYGRDLFDGAMALVVRRGKIFADYVENVDIEDNENVRNKITVQIGDGKHEQAPIAKIQRKIVGLEQWINIVSMAN